jgi:hypothetical protein
MITNNCIEFEFEFEFIARNMIITKKKKKKENTYMIFRSNTTVCMGLIYQTRVILIDIVQT